MTASNSNQPLLGSAHRLSRRRVLLGSAALGAAVWAGGAPRARATTLDYDSADAFDVAEEAYFGQGFENNEGGGYAWGASYYLLGLLRMYEAHQDTGYLDRFIDYADQVLNNTDEARGVTDFAGRSGPVWRTGGNYTNAHGTVQDAAGAPVVQIRWAGTRSSESVAEISDVEGDSFTLTLRQPTMTAPIVLTGLSLDPQSDDYLVDAVNAIYATNRRWTAVDLREAPTAAPAPPAATIDFEQLYYVFAVHTGMVAYPLAKFARMVLNDPKLATGRRFGQAKRIKIAAEHAIAFHDHEWEQRADGTGDYRWPKGVPVPFDGTIQPFNQSNALGAACAELHRLTGDQHHLDKVEAQIASLRGTLAVDGDDAYIWSYWPKHSELYQGFQASDGISEYTPSYSPSQQIEDLSHAAITVEFAYTAHAAGASISAVDLERFTRTYTRNLVLSPTTVAARVDGGAAATASNAVQCARWGFFAEQDRTVYEHSLALYEALELEPNQGSHALGIGYLNWGRLAGWERG